jgi:hypothetical protein
MRLATVRSCGYSSSTRYARNSDTGEVLSVCDKVVASSSPASHQQQQLLPATIISQKMAIRNSKHTVKKATRTCTMLRHI